MKKLEKVLNVLVIAIMLACICTNVFAAISIDDVSSDTDLKTAGETIKTIGSTIFTVVTNVGIIVAVVILAVLGIKYMMGSTEEKAEYKKSMIPYLIGAILLFGASAIAKMAKGLGEAI